MDRSKQFILEGVAVGLAVILAGFFVLRGTDSGMTNENPAGMGNTPTVNIPAGEKYTTEVPVNAEVTTPQTEAPAAPNSEATAGVYEVRATKNGFEPAVLTLKQGNLAQIKFTAVDDTYDFSISYNRLYQVAKKGETKNISFQLLSSGTFVFECRDFCPAGKHISGQLVVLPN